MAEQPKGPASNPVLVHFYRAVVGHSDVWRQRMDATTNWAVATTAALITFVLGTPEVPHFVLLLALPFVLIFLLMEARRYQSYHLWRRRFHLLNRYLVAPALSELSAEGYEEMIDEFDELATDLGRTTPRIGLLYAAGYRIQRNYGYLFSIILLAWALKLAVHPSPAQGARDLVERAGVGGAAGTGVVAGVVVFFLFVLLLAARAPSERMVGWAPRPSLWGRWFGGG